MRQLPYDSPLLTRVVGTLVTIAVVAVGLTVGLALFLVILGIGAIAFAVIYARMYWLRRRFVRHAQEAQRTAASRGRQDVIEGEYTVERSVRQRR